MKKKRNVYVQFAGSFCKELLRCTHWLAIVLSPILLCVNTNFELFFHTTSKTVENSARHKKEMIFNCVCNVNVWQFGIERWVLIIPIVYRCVITASRSSCTTGHSKSTSRSLVQRGSGKGGEEWRRGVKYAATATTSE